MFIFIGRRITKWRNVVDAPIQVDLKRKYGSTIHCNLEPTNMDVTYYCFEEHKNENNELCPFVNKNTRFPGVDYGKYETKFLNMK